MRNIRERNVIHDPFSVCRQFRDDALPRCTDIIGKNIRIRRAVEVLRLKLLCLCRIQILQIFCGNIPCATVVDDLIHKRDRRLAE